MLINIAKNNGKEKNAIFYHLNYMMTHELTNIYMSDDNGLLSFHQRIKQPSCIN